MFKAQAKRTGVIDPAVASYWKEHFDLRHILQRDWAALGALGGVGDNFPYDPELGQHPGSAETADRDAMDALLRDDVSILRALCILLAPDYACFDYAMPPECADLQASLAHTCPLDDGWHVARAVK